MRNKKDEIIMIENPDKIIHLIFVTATLPLFIAASMLIIQLIIHTPDITIITQALEIEIFFTATLPFFLASWVYKAKGKN